jgi:hypothetical protein
MTYSFCSGTSVAGFMVVDPGIQVNTVKGDAWRTDLPPGEVVS